jgi:hypothetical protein
VSDDARDEFVEEGCTSDLGAVAELDSHMACEGQTRLQVRHLEDILQKGDVKDTEDHVRKMERNMLAKERLE